MPAKAAGHREAPTTGYKPFNLTTCGAIPGILDPSQPERILREPGSILVFSAFDPLTASGQSASLDFRKLSFDEEHYRPKRVVIEISPSGQSTWRFVPKAKREDGLEDEGSWPRVVDICGQLAYCSQDQWDLYKLDPFYSCFVKAFPALSTVRVRDPKRPTPPTSKKRTHSNGSDSMPEGLPQKRVHYTESITMKSVTSNDSGAEEEDEVEVMITDDHYHYRNPTATTTNWSSKRFKSSSRATSSRATTPKPAKPVSQASSSTPNSQFYHAKRQSESLPPENHKRKVDAYPESLHPSPDSHYAEIDTDDRPRKRATYEQNGGKRTRTVSPGEAQRQLQAKRREREEQKRKRWEEERDARMHDREQRMMHDLMADILQEQMDRGNRRGDQDHCMAAPSSENLNARGTSHVDEEEAARAQLIAESRRKLAELERDRPLWEEAARDRRAREQAEEAERQAKIEAQKRAEGRRARQEREKEQQRQQEEEAQRRREAQLQEQERLRRAKERRARWSSGRWTIGRAIDRFKETSDFFEMTRFSEQQPLMTDDVPWPTLRHPETFSLEDVDWASVEHFFDVLKTHMRAQEYITLVEKSHRRFHPDRWRSRNLFKAVLDSEERNCMEVAATTVSQALTPIWQKVRAMKQA